jgi:hypothetical protein
LEKYINYVELIDEIELNSYKEELNSIEKIEKELKDELEYIKDYIDYDFKLIEETLKEEENTSYQYWCYVNSKDVVPTKFKQKGYEDYNFYLVSNTKYFMKQNECGNYYELIHEKYNKLDDCLIYYI